MIHSKIYNEIFLFSFKNRELRSDEKTEIVSGNGVSYLTLDHVTYDHAGKYEVSVENSLGKERRYFSLGVEGEFFISLRSLRLGARKFTVFVVSA